MEKYIGVKELTAKPMNRLEYVTLRGWELPSDENGEDEGFFVIDVNQSSNVKGFEGYVSWSPDEVFKGSYKKDVVPHEFDLKELLPHQQRVMDEYDELNKKANDLEIFIGNNPIFLSLSEDEQGLLKQQLLAMKAYRGTLRERILNF